MEERRWNDPSSLLFMKNPARSSFPHRKSKFRPLRESPSPSLVLFPLHRLSLAPIHSPAPSPRRSKQNPRLNYFPPLRRCSSRRSPRPDQRLSQHSSPLSVDQRGTIDNNSRSLVRPLRRIRNRLGIFHDPSPRRRAASSPLRCIIIHAQPTRRSARRRLRKQLPRRHFRETGTTQSSPLGPRGTLARRVRRGWGRRGGRWGL